MTLKKTAVNEVYNFEITPVADLILEKQLKDHKFSIEELDSIFEGIVDITTLATKLNGKEILITWSKYYVGICADYKQRLVQHKVTENYYVMTTKDEIFARAIERYFVKKRGAQGDTGGGINNPKQIYIYKITETTHQGVDKAKS